MTNTNCLRNMRCPQCGSEGPLKIEVTGMATFYDDGGDFVGDMSWEDSSYCECLECHQMATAASFYTPQS